MLKETRTAKKALENAMNMEMGIQNQLKISGSPASTTTNEITSQTIINVQGSWNRSRASTSQFVKPTICSNCGYSCSPFQRQKCPARGKNCKNCGIANHFAKVCRKTKESIKPKPRVNYVGDSVSEAATVGTSKTAADQVNNINRRLQQQSFYDANYDSDYDDYDDNCVAAISIQNNAREVEPVNLDICVGNTKTKALVDSGSVCTNVNKSLADTVVSGCKESYWVQSPEIHDLKTFSNDIIKIVGVINTSIKCNDWIATGVDVTVVEDGHRPIIGRDLFPKLGLSLTQLKQFANIDQNQCLIKKQIAFDFPDLVTRIGKSLKHSVKSTFHKVFTPTHQKGRRVPINLQPLVNIELKKLPDEKHIIKLNSCSDKNFISPIVITVKRDKTVKLTLDSKILNESIHKNKYQMPNIDKLINTIQQNLNTSASQETAYFSTLDLKYAYSQLKLDPETTRHCNFNIISGERTGTYRFITGFYGLTDMPTAFQKVMDYTFVGLQNTYCFLDDIIVVSRGSKEDHLKLVYKCLKKLDEDNLRINLPKYHFAKTEIEWLGHKLSQSGIAPLELKTAAIASLLAPNNLKQLRSFLGSVHYLGKFIPNLSQLCQPLQPLLKKNTKFVWKTEHETHFQAIKSKVANATENTHYNPHLETRIKCDASRAGLGAALEQRSPTGWHTVAFASRFLNSNEERYSVNELELLGFFLSVEYFEYYLFDKSFTIITDHRALLSIMKEHQSNKSYNSRLTRWIDRLLPFDFNIEHIPGAKKGLVDYISRQPNQEAKVTNKYDEEFAVATITRIRDAIAAIFVNTTPQNCQSQHFNSVTHTHSTRASHPRLTNYSNLLFALNRSTNKLLLENSANAAPFQSSSINTSNSTSIPTRSEIPTHASHIHTISPNTMSNITSNPQTPPTHSRVTFQSTPNSAVNTTRSSNEGQNSPNLDLSKEEFFENNLTQLFTKGFLAVLTSKDAVLKEVRDCILQNDPQRCKEVNPHMYCYWRDLHVRSGCVCIDERVAIPHSIQDAVLESLHLTHPGSWGMITLGQYAFWPYMHREILNKAAQCKPCTDIDADTVPVEDYLDENGWVTGDCSDILIEEAMHKAQVDAGRRYNGDHNKSISRFIVHPKLNNPIPRTEQSPDLNLTRKVTKRSKRDLRGLWETLAPGSTVVRTTDTTTVIKEPGVPEVCVRNSDIAKFGTRAERNTDLREYAKRRPLPYEKTTEEKISQHTKELKTEFRGEIKIRHRPTQSDAASGVSSANSNISKAMASRKPKKPQVGGKRSRNTSATLNTSNASSVAASSVTSSAASPSTSRNKRTRRAPRLFRFRKFFVLR